VVVIEAFGGVVLGWLRMQATCKQEESLQEGQAYWSHAGQRVFGLCRCRADDNRGYVVRGGIRRGERSFVGRLWQRDGCSNWNLVDTRSSRSKIPPGRCR
jgi:hypothetical protein